MTIFPFARALRAGVAAAFLVGLAGTAWAQSAADPTGEPPIGIEEKSGAKGPALAGVLAVKLINVNIVEADAAEAVVRLRRGSTLDTFFAALDGPILFETDEEKAQLQADLLDALRDQILGSFFPETCGALGDQCPQIDIVLKQADEFGLADDGAANGNQYVIMDVTVATSEPL